MKEEDPIDPSKIARLAHLTLLEREELALLIGDATIEFWLRGLPFEWSVEKCLEAAIFDEPNGPVHVNVSREGSSA